MGNPSSFLGPPYRGFLNTLKGFPILSWGVQHHFLLKGGPLGKSLAAGERPSF